MSEKEQVEALKLLGEWLRVTANVARGLATSADAATIRALGEKTQKFMKLEVEPESHGQRRR